MFPPLAQIEMRKTDITFISVHPQKEAGLVGVWPVSEQRLKAGDTCRLAPSKVKKTKQKTNNNTPSNMANTVSRVVSCSFNMCVKKAPLDQSGHPSEFPRHHEQTMADS